MSQQTASLVDKCLIATPEFRQGLLGGEVSARLPITSRTHGVLDNIIADWHKWFGLRNGHRDEFPNYMYHYTIVTREGLGYNDEGDTFGIGDLALTYKYPLWDREEGCDAAALRAGIKVPLGSPDKALGSGNWDLQVGALYQRQFGERWRGYANIDWVFVGDPYGRDGGAGLVTGCELAFHAPITGRRASDHFGLVVEILFPDRA